MAKLTVYSDGACSGNPGPGGWGYVIIEDGETVSEGFGHDVSATNNAMELRGVARALVEADALLRSRKELDGSSITVRSDSDYIVNAFNKRWLDKWRINGWKTVAGKHVANYPEWISLLQIVKSLRSTGCGVVFEHVAGHSGEPLNERADELAVKGRSVAATKRLNGEM